MHNIDWCEGGLKLADIATKNVGGSHDHGPDDHDKNIMYALVFLPVSGKYCQLESENAIK